MSRVDDTIHGTALRVVRSGVLIRGAAGSGKSSLALAFLEDSREDCRLVADDRVALSIAGGRLVAAPPPGLAGLIEVRGVGIVSRPWLAEVGLDLVVDLLPPEQCPRMPTAEEALTVILGVELPRLILPAGGADGHLRVRVALKAWAS